MGLWKLREGMRVGGWEWPVGPTQWGYESLEEIMGVRRGVRGAYGCWGEFNGVGGEVVCLWVFGGN